MGAPGPGAEKGDDETEFYGLAQLLRYHKNALQFLLLAVKLNSKIFHCTTRQKCFMYIYIYICVHKLWIASQLLLHLRRSSSFPV